MTGETAGDAGRGAAQRGDRRLGPGGARRRCRAAGRLGDGATGRARRRRAAACSCRSTSMPCRVRRCGPGRCGPGGGDRRRPVDRAPAAARTPVTVEPGDLPTALAAAIADPSRIEVHAGDGVAALEPWLAAPAGGRRSGLLLDDPRPRRGSPLALRGGRHGRPDGRGRRRRGRGRAARSCSSGSRSRSSATRSSRCSWPGIARRPRTRPRRPVAFDTQIAAYILNASLRSQTIADVVAEQLDLDPAAGRGARRPGPRRARGALGARRPRAARAPAASTRASTGSIAEIELPLIPVLARMEATGVALDLEALAVLATRVRGRDLAARGGDLRRRRPRVHPRQPQAARADPVLRAQPAEGQADEDRLLDRRVGARGPAAGATR